MRRNGLVCAGLLAVLAVLAALLTNRLHGDVRQTAGQTERVLLPVAMYHSVTDEGESPGQYVISPAMLESDLQYLRAQGRKTVTIQDLIDYVENGTELPEKPVLLTFDDGYYNNYRYAYPLLKSYGMQAVLSPVGILTEQFTQTDDPEEHETWSYCTAAELREMSDSGVMEIQNHSYDFHELTPRRGCLRMAGEDSGSYRQSFLSDTEQAQQLLISIGIPAPVCYTYPYGACNEETAELTETYGFSVTLSCSEGVAVITRDETCLQNIRRNNRDGRLTSEQFWKKLLAQTEEGTDGG